MLDGLYDLLLTARLQTALAAAARHPELSPLDKPDAPSRLAHFLADEIERVLRDLPGDVTAQAQFANSLLTFLRAQGSSEELAIPPQLLTSLGASHPRPETPLSISTLLAGRHNLNLGRELNLELESADRVDALVSFVTWSGYRRIETALKKLADSKIPIRLITTTYTGATDARAVREIASLPNATVRVAYNGERSRLHAKAWLFHRQSGFSTAYIGSANLSGAALNSGVEWVFEATQADLRHVIDLFRGAFDSLWAGDLFEPFTPGIDDDRLTQALDDARGSRPNRVTADTPLFFNLKPWPWQRQILDDLHEQREALGRNRNLIVAATGTGKTMVAAFDYERLPGRPKLLWLAHREELLVQALHTFRHVLRDGSFGELLTGTKKPSNADHLFATIQSFLNSDLLAVPDRWHYAVIDECHHVAAASYQQIMGVLRPSILVGLTATPERLDGKDIRPDFDERIAAEIRLWHAIEKHLIVPFEYYGLSDNTNLSGFELKAGNYTIVDLESVYLRDHARADLIAEKWRHYRGGKTLGFCVSVKHAEYMAEQFTKIGIPAMAVTGDSPERDAAPVKLQSGQVQVLFTCDLYNEGIDLPFVDTLLFLRPTSSATVFLQQLGRGLREYDKKESCLVLDFVGQHRKEFRMDSILTAMTGVPRGKLTKAVEHGFATLPPGCHLELDKVAAHIIVENLKHTIGGGRLKLSRELKSVGDVDLRTFLAATGRPASDVYDAGGWTSLRHEAGYLKATPEEFRVSERFGRLLHIDDIDRLKSMRSHSGLVLGYQLWHEHDDLFGEWATRLTPNLRRELLELADQLQEHVHPTSTSRVIGDLRLHRSYARREVLAGAGFWTSTRKPSSREGVLRIEDAELLFVTLDKSGKSFSPTTRYEDYAISASRFHWQSQSTTGEDTPTGRKYQNRDSRFLLFVRPTPNDPYVALGRCIYESHTGSRPMSITWRLENEIPPGLLEVYATLAA
ncbi:MAG: type III restriction enzyme res [Planctomycetota bacterium]|nr:MAG: type III restriction enzyme res [Planctomycetota bacterium]